MTLRRRLSRPNRRKPEPTIALINIVFLMLVFFLVAGTLAPPLDPELDLVDTAQLDGAEPPNALVITATGDLRFRGAVLQDPLPYLETLAEGDPARILPDREAPATQLVETAQELRRLGAKTILIVTAKAPQEPQE